MPGKREAAALKQDARTTKHPAKAPTPPPSPDPPNVDPDNTPTVEELDTVDEWPGSTPASLSHIVETILGRTPKSELARALDHQRVYSYDDFTYLREDRIDRMTFPVEYMAISLVKKGPFMSRTNRCSRPILGSSLGVTTKVTQSVIEIVWM